MTKYASPGCFTLIFPIAARTKAALTRLCSPLRLPGRASWSNPLWAAAVTALLHHVTVDLLRDSFFALLDGQFARRGASDGMAFSKLSDQPSGEL